MNIGKACAIFEQIQKEKYSDNEKLWAIKDVLDMPTHNGITKDTILNTFKWFFDYAIEEAQEESTKHEVQTRWIPVRERLPKPEEEVLVTAVHRYGEIVCKYIVAPAIYEDGTVLECDSTWSWEDIDGEWDEKNDCQIIPEGWWENRRYNPECTYNCPIDDEVVAWMPLPEYWKGEGNAK